MQKKHEKVTSLETHNLKTRNKTIGGVPSQHDKKLATKTLLPLSSSKIRAEFVRSADYTNSVLPNPLSRIGTIKRSSKQNQRCGSWSNREEWLNSDLRISSRMVATLTELVAVRYNGKRFHRQKHITAISMLLANLIKSDGAWIRYSRRRESFYNTAFCSGIGRDPFVRVVDILISDGLLENRRGYYDSSRNEGAVSLMRTTQRFDHFMTTAKPKECCVIEVPTNLDLLVCRDFPSDISEPPATKTWRRQLHDYNQLLLHSEVQLNGSQLQAQYLWRVFNRDWLHGGRFYGGSWQNEPGVIRRLITINGEPVVELDYSELHLRMLYADIGVNPSTDIYSIDGVDRTLMKVTALVAINSKDRASATKCLQHKMNKRELDTDHTPSELLAKFENAHPLLRPQLNVGRGLELQNKDSKLVEYVLDEMTRAGILALPVHDSFLVAARHSNQLRQSMKAAYIELVGFEPKIAVKSPEMDRAKTLRKAPLVFINNNERRM